MTKLEGVKHSEKISLENWRFEIPDFAERLEEVVGTAVREAFEMPNLEKCFKDALGFALEEAVGNSYVHFPIDSNYGDNAGDGMGGPPVDNPLTVYLCLPYSETDNGVTVTFDLEDVVDQSIDSCSVGGVRESFYTSGPIGPQHRKSMEALRDGFLRMAEKLNAALLK